MRFPHLAVALALLAFTALAQTIVQGPKMPLNSGFSSSTSASPGGAACLEHTNALTGIADSKTFTFSVWLRLSQTNTGPYIFDISSGAGSHRFSINLTTSNTVSLFGSSPTPSQVLLAKSSLTMSTGLWHHVYMAIDLASTNNRHIYVDGTGDSSVTWTTYINAAMDLNPTGAAVWIYKGWNCTTAYVGSMAELWFDDIYLDSPSSFRNGTHPADIGANGEIPSGSPPALYLSRAGSGNSWATDSSGNGNNFTIVAGSLSSDTPP